MEKVFVKKGFVFGKFMPFHNGHKTLIDFALQKVDYLFIVICASDKESLPLKLRSNWIEYTYSGNAQVEIIPFKYSENELPNTSTPDVDVSKLWAAKFEEILPDVELVITSEKYGAYVAKAMNITSILFDQARSHVPISASAIRNNVVDNWDYLPDIVKRYYQKKIVLLGTESTGKSSLSRAITEYLNASLVEEAGRDLIEHSSQFSLEDLHAVIEEHSERIIKATNELKPFVIIDTDIHITQSYAKYQFGEYMADISSEIYKIHQANVYFYLTAEFPYADDGTRMPLEERNILDEYHRSTLKHFKIEHKIIDISGDWDERLSAMLDKITLKCG